MSCLLRLFFTGLVILAGVASSDAMGNEEGSLDLFYYQVDELKDVVSSNPLQGLAALEKFEDNLTNFPDHALVDYYSLLSTSYLYNYEFEKAYKIATDALDDIKGFRLNISYYDLVSIQAYAASLLNLDNAETLLRRSLNVAQQLGGENIIIDANMQLGSYYTKQSKFVLAHHHITEALKYAEKIGNEIAIAHTTFTLSKILSRMDKEEDAVQNALRSLSIYKQNDRYESQITTMNFIGSLYIALGEPNLARDFLKKSLSLAAKYSAENTELNIRFNIARLENSIGEHDEAINILRSFEESQVLEGVIGTPVNYYAEFISALLGDNRKQEALTLLNDIESKLDFEEQTPADQINITRITVDVLEESEMFEKALKHLHSYAEAALEHEKNKGQQIIKELMVKYDADRKELENEKLQNENVTTKLQLEISEKKRENQINIMLFSGALAFLIILFLGIQIVSRRRLDKMVHLDTLTAVPNRYALMKKGKKIMETDKDKELSVILLDIDNFKTINDTFGHEIGDNVLIDIASIGMKTVSSNQWFGRLGGEEFIAILPATSKSKGIKTAERMLANFKGHDWSVHGLENTVTASIGVATMKVDENVDFEELLRLADHAMYFGKTHGKNQVVHIDNIEEQN